MKLTWFSEFDFVRVGVARGPRSWRWSRALVFRTHGMLDGVRFRHFLTLGSFDRDAIERGELMVLRRRPADLVELIGSGAGD